MGRSNGCKAEQKRARNEKNAPKEGKSQLKQNEKSLTLICSVCRQPFMKTQGGCAVEHARSKHPNKSVDECFPDLAA
ncbi:unnamed protein product [Vitrella brassicaformis CCMP3155]|uniref:Uncharacterized protein n=1 Tax=Vitrella brassicaformis (strain CCMP3155) TaxID=1169540 RepID=A0A0G4G5K7_VITBC|nr:unnamed protein product [Vitrella brassicaformis CCMP3155]|eukprot:CEM23343.1 unnamed protein product [Vitrella brassicaformis CCMP3155]